MSLADLADRGWLVVFAFTAVGLGSPLTAVLVVAAGSVPRAVLVLIGGAFADRLPTRSLLVAADLFRVVVLVLAAVALRTHAMALLPLLVLVGIAFGAADALHLPAVGTMPRQLVDEEGLVRVAGLRQLGSRVAFLAGPPLAGLALAGLRLPSTLIVLGVPLLLAALALGGLRPSQARIRAPRQSVPAAVRDLLGHLRRDRTARALVLSLIGLNFFPVPVVTIGIAFRASAEGWGPAVLGVLVGLVGAGAIAGTAVTMRLKLRRPLRFAYAMLSLQGVALILVGFAPAVGVGAALLAVGITSGLACPQLAGMVQSRIDPSYLGRVFSVIALSDDGILPLALAGFGAVVGTVGLPWAVGLCGIGMVIWMGSSLLRPGLRDLTLRDEATGSADAVAADPLTA